MARTRRRNQCHRDWSSAKSILKAARRVSIWPSALGDNAPEKLSAEQELLENLTVLCAVVELAPECWQELLQRKMSALVEEDYHLKKGQFWQVWLDCRNRLYNGTTFRLEAEVVQNRVQTLKAGGLASDKNAMFTHLLTRTTHAQLSMLPFLIRYFEAQEPGCVYPRLYGYKWYRYESPAIPVVNAHAFSIVTRIKSMVGAGCWQQGPYVAARKALVKNYLPLDLRNRILALAFSS